jgi:hypothetical protein
MLVGFRAVQGLGAGPISSVGGVSEFSWNILPLRF